jgi:hypothetical protein
MTPEQRLDAARRQAELDASVAKAREERLKAAQEAEDAKLRDLYAGKSATPYLVAPAPYGIVTQTGQTNLIHVTITGGSVEVGSKPRSLQIAPFTMAPCEVKEVGVYTSSSFIDYRVWVAYIPPAFYWDVRPPSDKKGLHRYVSCDGDQLLKEAYRRPAIIPISASHSPLDHKGDTLKISGATVSFSMVSSPLPLAR